MSEEGRRMKTNKKSKKKHTICVSEELCTVSLPEELIMEILLRLPMKSILRFRCVCKSWRSLISNPQFAQLHYDLAAAPTHRFLLRVTDDSDSFVESIDPEARLRDKSAVLHLRLPPPVVSIPFIRLNHGRYGSVRLPRIEVCGSCRGFVLINNNIRFVSNGPLRFVHDLVVWNPLTSVYKQIPPDSDVNGMNNFLYGFGYDASTDDYLVIFVDLEVASVHHRRNKYVMVKSFSVKFNSWDGNYIEMKDRYIEMKDRYNEDNDFDGEIDFKAGSLLDGTLHWLVKNDKHNYVIMAFDLVDRSLSEIPLPPILNIKCEDGTLDFRGLRVIGGCLCVWVSMGGGWNEMWMMKEYKVLSSWTRSFRFGHDRTFYDFSPICLTKDDALFGSDLRRQRLRKVCGESTWLRETFSYGKGKDYLHCNLQCSLYRESLLSLPTKDDQ